MSAEPCACRGESRMGCTEVGVERDLVGSSLLSRSSYRLSCWVLWSVLVLVGYGVFVHVLEDYTMDHLNIHREQTT